ncbi:diacylglycerol kinase family protein [Loktanella sp. SALINAS62]|uniref:diacylglycerol/lipid kinase family protein n=1 Tax=Loktanella sp. SALINAS62 TaxID=2706124 RepID=UPI001B8D29EC|nr:diacylglycerol kinase family protein [Loktanella sp. SALINAS62]MBS1300964.1 diacylglycerol kinase [Loktanella sp. SALINAS62]
MAKPTTCVILNPASGKKKDNPDTQTLIAKINAEPRLSLRTLDRPSDLPRAVRDALAEGFDTIVAAGGDGTIGGVTGELIGTDVTLAILPLGTFNFMARSLGIPDDPDAALRVALDGETVPMTVGEVNGKVFLNNASLGAYAAVLDVREGVYKRWGRSRIAAYWSVIVAMLTIYRPLRMKVTVDGKVHMVKSPMAFVASSAYQLEQYEFEGADAVREGKLALILAPDNNRVQLLWRAVKILFGSIHRDSDYYLHIGEDILIETRRGSRLVARDGERATMNGPYRFVIRRDALRVKVPTPDQAEREG